MSYDFTVSVAAGATETREVDVCGLSAVRLAHVIWDSLDMTSGDLLITPTPAGDPAKAIFVANNISTTVVFSGVTHYYLTAVPGGGCGVPFTPNAINGNVHQLTVSVHNDDAATRSVNIHLVVTDR